MKPNPVKTSVASARTASRCQYLTATGRRCCSLAVEPVSGLCQRHADAQERLDRIDHSRVLTRFSRGFQTVEGINFALGDLYVLLAQGRISPQRAAVLTRMASLMLRTLPVMHRSFGKYRCRYIGSARPPEQDQEPDVDEEGESNEPDDQAESDEVSEPDVQAEPDEPTDQAQSNEPNDQAEHEPPGHQNICEEADYRVPPGLTPLPASREAFLSAVGKAKAEADAAEVEPVAPPGSNAR